MFVVLKIHDWPIGRMCPPKLYLIRIDYYDLGQDLKIAETDTGH